MRAVFVGLATLDVIHRVDRLPGPDEKINPHSTELAAGGPAANAAKTFAALGGQALLVTALGTGATAALVRADLAAHGVEVLDAARSASPPVATVLVGPGGERAVVGATSGGSTGPIDVAAALEGAQVVLIDGHYPDVAQAMAAAARQRGVRTVVDAGRPKPVWARLLPNTDVAICSADFRVSDPGGQPIADDRAGIASALLAAGVMEVAITAGAGPIHWWTSEGAAGQVSPPTVTAVDTLGAGDILHGGFCFHAVAGAPFVDALAAASALASDRCAHVGLGQWLIRRAGAARWTP